MAGRMRRQLHVPGAVPRRGGVGDKTPKYDGDLVMVASIPLALGSWWALAIPAITIAALVVRILDEERILAKDLPGYAEYEQKVRYRLVPHLW